MQGHKKVQKKVHAYYHFVQKSIKYRLLSNDEVFTEIYRNNEWRGQGSVSGPGSELSATSVIRTELPILLEEVSAKTLLDAPCGDFFWMKETNLQLEKYFGIDVVDEIIQNNQKKYARNERIFVKADIIKDPLPKVDVILCRDCLVHFSYEHISSTIENFKKSKSKYLLTTTFPNYAENKDIITGLWRPINLEKNPFNLPKPIKVINEKCTWGNGKFSDKSLGLWKLESI